MTTETTATETPSTTPGAESTPSADNPSLLGTDTPAETTETKTGEAEAKPGAEETKPAEVEYKFEPLEGVQFDTPHLEKFTALAKEHKLPANVAQDIVKLASEMELARVAEHTETVKGWLGAVKADKELGGDKLPESLAVAKKTFGLLPKEQAAELKGLLNATGLEAHPAFFRLFHAVGKALSEDSFTPAGKAPAVVGDAASRLYPTTAKTTA